MLWLNVLLFHFEHAECFLHAWRAAELREDAESALEEARSAVEAEDWEAGREACREALRLMVQAGMTKELSELEELEKRIRDGETKCRERKEGGELVQKAKAALGSGDFEGAREALLEAKGAFRRAGWEEGEKELQAIFGLVEAGEKRATRRREGDQSLTHGQVCYSDSDCGAVCFVWH
jgi:hypothetical protein